MKKHRIKKVAPVIVSVCLIAYFAFYGLFLVNLDMPGIIKIGILIVSVILAGVTIAVLAERLKEIDGGEEDDLGKY